ncbi:DUF6221 family protein [Streptomyces albus subsp. chlorinus]|uniref:DUF6221 family protein n=1 Tax=Streptomyces albus TaxID=1888 RepID=UPI0031F6B438
MRPALGRSRSRRLASAPGRRGSRSRPYRHQIACSNFVSLRTRHPLASHSVTPTPGNRGRIRNRNHHRRAERITAWRHRPPSSRNVVGGHDQLVVACPDRGIADHMATWGPTAALENADSRRMILDLYEEAPPGPARERLLGAVRALAMAYR